jgi:2-oxoglutarate ferredoxin oxidoreductase subunit gamma
MRKTNKRHTVIAAGVGGSGVVLLGTLIARAGLRKYEHATRFPNFSAYMRGGPCECTVILSEIPILSPVVARGDVLLILNNSQLPYFEERVRPGGVIILESTGLKTKLERKDVRLFEIPAIEIAASMGSTLVSNMILLGAYVQATNIFPPEFIEKELEARFGIVETGVRALGKEALLAQNVEAFRRGLELAKTVGR